MEKLIKNLVNEFAGTEINAGIIETGNDVFIQFFKPGYAYSKRYPRQDKTQAFVDLIAKIYFAAWDLELFPEDFTDKVIKMENPDHIPTLVIDDGLLKYEFIGGFLYIKGYTKKALFNWVEISTDKVQLIFDLIKNKS